MKLYLLTFQNYFNRIIKRFETIEEYLISPYYVAGNFIDNIVGFNPNDGVDTQTTIPFASNFNYAIYTEEVSGVETIISRWWIMQSTRNTARQFRINLHRDVIADNYQEIIRCPMFIEKATLPQTDELITADEGMMFNRIKKKEELVGFNEWNEQGWIVGYISKSTPASNISVPYSAPLYTTTLEAIATAMGNITAAQLAALLNFGNEQTNPAYFANSDVSFYYGIVFNNPSTGGGYGIYKSIYTLDNALETNVKTSNNSLVLKWDYYLYDTRAIPLPTITSSINQYISGVRAEVVTITAAQHSSQLYLDSNQLAILKSYVGEKILYNSKVYSMSISTKDNVYTESKIKHGDYANFDLIMEGIGGSASIRADGEFYISYNATESYIIMKEVETANITIPVSSSRNTCAGSVTDIFAIPFGNIGIGKTDSGTFTLDYRCIADHDSLFKIASVIATMLDANLYDIQLVPYLPNMMNVMTHYVDGTLQINPIYILDPAKMTAGVDYDYIDDALGAHKSIILWLKNASFSKTITHNKGFKHEVISQLNYCELKTSMKIDSQCDFYRLCSPNYSGVFEFNLAKNGGQPIYQIDVDCTLKPYSPYIHLNPPFNFLYGVDYNDNRGLICGGDFSLSRIEDKWINYQLNNKNYGAIFNREIENLDFSQGQERIYNTLEAVTGTIKGGIMGAAAGGKMGGVYGAIAGAVVGTGASAAGGVIDYSMAEERRSETKDYARDRFNYSLGNVKALPLSLSKVSAFNIQNKIFPFIETYSCTDKERQALVDKLKYDGMTVNRIGYMIDYMSSTPQFIRGQLIRCESFAQNNHYFNIIYDELLKGVYI